MTNRLNGSNQLPPAFPGIAEMPPEFRRVFLVMYAEIGGDWFFARDENHKQFKTSDERTAMLVREQVRQWTQDADPKGKYQVAVCQVNEQTDGGTCPCCGR